MDEYTQLIEGEYRCDKDWMGIIRMYIMDGEVPSDKWVARKLKVQATRYIMLDGEVFKWRFSGLLMAYVDRAQARRIMEEVTSGFAVIILAEEP